MPTLSDIIKVHRRYYRSVNLERDLAVADSVLGYIPTSKSLDALERVTNAYLSPGSIRSWTVSGVYGIGKSAFAHFLSALSTPNKEKINKNARSILINSSNSGKRLAKIIQKSFPNRGLLKAVVTAQREPVIRTIVRGLEQGAIEYWSTARGAKPRAYRDLIKIAHKMRTGTYVDNHDILSVIIGLAEASKSGLLIIIDELGKNLEHTAQNQSIEDLYILQQLAELPSESDAPQVLTLGLLHQSFSDYAHGLTAAQRNEWAKIQGRFEDLPLYDSLDQAIKLLGSSIDQSNVKTDIKRAINNLSTKWVHALKNLGIDKNIVTECIASVYPLHPISALTLPILCSRYAQNDRTLFTFLTSSEPSAFQNFLSHTNASKENLPSLKIHEVYDYFVENTGASISLSPQLQRWLEIHDRIHDARFIDQDKRCALKTIGVLNLISTAGPLKASKDLVTLSLVDNPLCKNEIAHWSKVIASLIEMGLVTWRKQIDELRLWEGTDFDIEKEVSKNRHHDENALAKILNEYFPLNHIVISRHSYRSGTLRSFERLFVDKNTSKADIKGTAYNSDGLICYCIGDAKDFNDIPITTSEGKPIVTIMSPNHRALQLACSEYVALEYTYRTSQKLKTDGIARREVSERRAFSKRILEQTFEKTFDFDSCDVTLAGSKRKIANRASFNTNLSDLCDKFYSKGPILWNELINRKELTSQGAKARRVLCEAMIERYGDDMLGLTGHGPEVSMFQSLLLKPGIYSQLNGQWLFTTPSKSSGLYSVWSAIKSFCKSSTSEPKSIDELYQVLSKPPYGLRTNVIPVLLLTVLIQNIDELSLYVDGTFIPMIGPEHFELLVKNPKKFAVKYFEIKGVRAKVFEELESIFQKPVTNNRKLRQNATLLSVVQPLIMFVRRLPKYTINTKRLSEQAAKVRETLLSAKEPDHLIFYALPEALGLSPIEAKVKDKHNTEAKEFKKKLINALQELQTTYDSLMAHCKDLLYSAFAIRSDKAKLREDLTVRANYLAGHCIEPTLRRFLNAATSDVSTDQEWLEPLLMVIADKPAENWKDEDILIFESKLSDIARKFINLEALQKGMAKHPSGGFTALRIAITKPNGIELNRLVWMDDNDKKYIEGLTEKIVAEEGLTKDKERLLSLIASLMDKVVAKSDSNQGQIKSKPELVGKKIG